MASSEITPGKVTLETIQGTVYQMEEFQGVTWAWPSEVKVPQTLTLSKDRAYIKELNLDKPLAIQSGGTGFNQVIPSMISDTVEMITAAAGNITLSPKKKHYYIEGTANQNITLPDAAAMGDKYILNVTLENAMTSFNVFVYRPGFPLDIWITIPPEKSATITWYSDGEYETLEVADENAASGEWEVFPNAAVRFKKTQYTIYCTGTGSGLFDLFLPPIGPLPTDCPIEGAFMIYNDSTTVIEVSDFDEETLAFINPGFRRIFVVQRAYGAYPATTFSVEWTIGAAMPIDPGPPEGYWSFDLEFDENENPVDNGIIQPLTYVGWDKNLNIIMNQMLSFYTTHTGGDAPASNVIIMKKDSHRSHTFNNPITNPGQDYIVYVNHTYLITTTLDEYSYKDVGFEYYLRNKSNVAVIVKDTDDLVIAHINPNCSAHVRHVGPTSTVVDWVAHKYLPPNGPAGNILRSDGTNWVSDLPTSILTAPGPVNSVLVSDGTTDWDVSEGTTDRNRILTSTSGNVPKWDLAFPTVVIGSYTPTIQFFYAGSEGASTQSVGAYGTRHGRFDYVECFPSDTVSSSNDRKRLITLDVYITVTTYAGSQTFLDEIRLPLPFSNNNFLSTSVTINNGGNCAIIFTSDTGQAYITKATTSTILNGYTLADGDVWHFSASYLHTP